MGTEKASNFSAPENQEFVGHFLYTPYGVIMEADQDGREVRQAHRPRFIRVQIKIKGNRLVVSPRRSQDSDSQNIVSLSLSSIQQIELTPALWKHSAFFPILICLCCLLLWGLNYAMPPMIEWYESFSIWKQDPDLVRMGAAILGLMLCCVPWLWRVWHKLWWTTIYSKVMISTRKTNFILYVSSWKDAEIANLLLQAGLTVGGELFAEE